MKAQQERWREYQKAATAKDEATPRAKKQEIAFKADTPRPQTKMRLTDQHTRIDTRVSHLRNELLAGLRRLEKVIDERLARIEQCLKLR